MQRANPLGSYKVLSSVQHNDQNSLTLLRTYLEFSHNRLHVRNNVQILIFMKLRMACKQINSNYLRDAMMQPYRV